MLKILLKIKYYFLFVLEYYPSELYHTLQIICLKLIKLWITFLVEEKMNKYFFNLTFEFIGIDFFSN